MQVLRLVLVGLIASLFACAGAEENPVAGKWKRSDNREIIEFGENGTLTRLATVSGRKFTFGGTYTPPSEGRIQLTLGPEGPASFGLEMLGDSMYLTDLEGKKVKYFRDRGDKPSLTYVLKTVDGHPVPYTHEADIQISPRSTVTERTEYRDGTLILDPMTRTFTLVQTIAQPGGSMGGPHQETIEGVYTLSGDSLTLRSNIPPGSPSLTGAVSGRTLNHGTFLYLPNLHNGEQFRPGPILGYEQQ